MKKISLILAIVGTVWGIQTVHAQTIDSAKNRIEVKKKVKTGAHGRQVTKIKMTGKGSEGAISGAANGAVTGRQPAPAPTPVVNPQPVNPTVVVVTPQPEKKTRTTYHDGNNYNRNQAGYCSNYCCKPYHSYFNACCTL